MGKSLYNQFYIGKSLTHFYFGNPLENLIYVNLKKKKCDIEPKNIFYRKSLIQFHISLYELI